MSTLIIIHDISLPEVQKIPEEFVVAFPKDHHNFPQLDVSPIHLPLQFLPSRCPSASSLLGVRSFVISQGDRCADAPLKRRLRFVWLVMVGGEPNIFSTMVSGWCGWWFPEYSYGRIMENPPSSCKGGRTQKK